MVVLVTAGVIVMLVVAVRVFNAAMGWDVEKDETDNADEPFQYPEFHKETFRGDAREDQDS